MAEYTDDRGISRNNPRNTEGYVSQQGQGITRPSNNNTGANTNNYPAASGIDTTTLGIAAVGAALLLNRKKKRK